MCSEAYNLALVDFVSEIAHFGQTNLVDSTFGVKLIEDLLRPIEHSDDVEMYESQVCQLCEQLCDDMPAVLNHRQHEKLHSRQNALMAVSTPNKEAGGSSTVSWLPKSTAEPSMTKKLEHR